MKRRLLMIAVLVAVTGLTFAGGTDETTDVSGAAGGQQIEEFVSLGESDGDGLFRSYRGFTVDISREAFAQGVRSAFLELEDPPKSSIGVIGDLSVDRRAVAYENLVPVVNLDIWVEDDGVRRSLSDLDTTASPAPQVTVSVDLAELNKELFEYQISEESEFYFEFSRGTLFSLDAGETLGLIRVTERPTAADQTLEFVVFKWRVDDLMIYINDR